MSRQYLRTAQVSIAGGVFRTRIAFEIRKGEQGSVLTKTEVTSNKSTVSIFNLSEDSRGIIENQIGKGTMTLEAGYQDALTTLFIGDIAKVEIKRHGPDIETKIEAGDGEFQITDAIVEISLKEGATDAQIIDSAIKALGLGRGSISGIPNVNRGNGFSFSGLASDLLNQIALKNGLIWSVQNEAIQIRKDGDTSGRTAILLTDKTGLIGIPNKTDDGFEAECLLNPALEPGQLVKIKSALLTDEVTYEVNGVEHVGDTHGDKWTTKVWGKQP